jgi:hypothetical protein
MTTFQKSSSTSDDSAYRIAKMLFGLDRGEFDIALNNFNERYFQPIAHIAKILSETLSLFLLLRGNGMHSLRRLRRLPRYRLMKRSSSRRQDTAGKVHGTSDLSLG